MPAQVGLVLASLLATAGVLAAQPGVLAAEPTMALARQPAAVQTWRLAPRDTGGPQASSAAPGRARSAQSTQAGSPAVAASWRRSQHVAKATATAAKVAALASTCLWHLLNNQFALGS